MLRNAAQGVRLWFATTATLVALAVLASPATLRTQLQLLRDTKDAGTQSTAALAFLIGAAAWVAGGWLVALCALRLVARLPGTIGAAATALSLRLTPRLLSGAVRVSLTTTAGLGLLGQAVPTAAQAATRVASIQTERCQDSNTLPSLDRVAETCPSATATLPASVAATAPPSADQPNETFESTRIVQPGDTLWDIAADELEATGKTPTPQAIAHRWPSWWDANREAIGSDPALLHPGAVLHAPTTQQPEDR